MKYTMTQRKPFPIYDVEFEGKKGTVMKSEDEGVRCKRWILAEEGDEKMKFFKSRRAAFCFFTTGEKFKTNPIFAVLGGRRGTKRIR